MTQTRRDDPDTIVVTARDLTGGVSKIDPRRVDRRHARDAANWILHGGSLERRKGSEEVETFARPSGAITFPGTLGKRVEVPRNASCPIWTGIGRNWTLEFVEKPLADAAGAEELPIFRLYHSTAGDIIAVYAKTSYARTIKVQDDDMSSPSEKAIGTAEVNTTLYYRIRRFGRHLHTEIYGASGGVQSTTHTNVFSSQGVKMEASDSTLYIGGDSATKGPNSTLDEIRLINRYVDTKRYRWLEYTWMEDPDLMLYLRMNEGSGTTTADESLWANKASVVGAPTWTGTGLVQGIAVGQYLGDYGARTARQRVIGVAGSIYREVLS
jgi:hypothetical protein